MYDDIDWIFESSKLEDAREEAAGLPLETISSAIASSLKTAQTKA